MMISKEVERYLAKYDQNEEVVMRWLVSHNASPGVVAIVMDRFAGENKKFNSPGDMNMAMLREVQRAQLESAKNFFEMYKKYELSRTFWQRVKALWTRRQ